jgi:transcriptional regulator with XRE-family HTH domain
VKELDFKDKIRAMREDRDLNQTELGKILGMNQMKISRMETGTAEPSLADLVALCQFYDVSADYLLGLPEGLPYPKHR